MSWDDSTEHEGKVLNIEADQPTEQQQTLMLQLARQAITVFLEEGQVPHSEPDEPFLALRAGVFVTLREQQHQRQSGTGIGGPGLLRGCIGHMQPDRPLYQVVPDMAIQAATADPRFPPMNSAEVVGVTIEIAILSPIRPVESRDEIQIGEHGLVLAGEWQRALLLPKSPVIYGWDLDQYLANLHKKAGLPIGYWPGKGKLYAFTSFDFGEQGQR
ncbi:MAG TPA: AmmeMemoRadiSam system protein A [Anaerolineae bacterium]|nr:AmmeMemoRadiSam system protein A [Anaerolineae bacterium]